MKRIAVHRFFSRDDDGKEHDYIVRLRVAANSDSTTFKTKQCNLLTDVPPQPNSPPDNVFHLDRRRSTLKLERGAEPRFQLME